MTKDDDDIQDYVRPWVGLTDEEVDQAFTELTLRKIYQAIEAKLKEKNT
jgi:uncharacterized protein (DUF433 family)